MQRPPAPSTTLAPPPAFSPRPDLDAPLSPLDALASQTRTAKLGITSSYFTAKGKARDDPPTITTTQHSPPSAQAQPRPPPPARLNLDNVSSVVASNLRRRPRTPPTTASDDANIASPAAFLHVTPGDTAHSPLGLSTVFKSGGSGNGSSALRPPAATHSQSRAKSRSIMSIETDGSDYVWHDDDTSPIDHSFSPLPSVPPADRAGSTTPLASGASQRQALDRTPSAGHAKARLLAQPADPHAAALLRNGDGDGDEEVLQSAGLGGPHPGGGARDTWMSQRTYDTMGTDSAFSETDDDGIRYESGISVETIDPFQYAQYETPRTAPKPPLSKYPNPDLSNIPNSARSEDEFSEQSLRTSVVPLSPQSASQSLPSYTRSRALSVSSMSSISGVPNFSRPLRQAPPPTSPHPAPTLPLPPLPMIDEAPPLATSPTFQPPPSSPYLAAPSFEPTVVVVSPVSPSAPLSEAGSSLRSKPSRMSLESQSSSATKRSKGRWSAKKNLLRRLGSDTSGDSRSRDSHDLNDVQPSIPSPPPTVEFADHTVGTGQLKVDEMEKRWHEDQQNFRHQQEHEERQRWEAYDRTQNIIDEGIRQDARSNSWQSHHVAPDQHHESRYDPFASTYTRTDDMALETLGQAMMTPDVDQDQSLHNRSPSTPSDLNRYSVYSLPGEDQVKLRHELSNSNLQIQEAVKPTLDDETYKPTRIPQARFAPDLIQVKRDSRLPPTMAKTKAMLTLNRPSLKPIPKASSTATVTSPIRSAQDYVSLGIEAHEMGLLEDSAKLFERGARENGGCIGGMLMWGLALRHGWGVVTNQERGFRWLQKAAECVVESLDENGQIQTGNSMSVEGGETGGSRLNMTSELTLAIYELGQCFRRGWGCRKDKQLAISYFELAARLGDADAQMELGFSFANGKGAKKDLKRAAKYYRMATSQGVEMMNAQWIWKEKVCLAPLKPSTTSDLFQV